VLRLSSINGRAMCVVCVFTRMRGQVLLFDTTAASTYLCILGEGNRNVHEFWRTSTDEQWLKVVRSDKTKASPYQEAGGCGFALVCCIYQNSYYSTSFLRLELQLEKLRHW